MRLMLDTNIYDAIVADTAVTQRVKEMIANGGLTIITTHIQKDQLGAIPAADKRAAVFSIPTEKVVTSGAIWGLSKWNECTWTDPVTSTVMGQVTKGNQKHAADALIGVTAAANADVLVTNDRQLAARFEAIGTKVPVWDFDEFLKFILQPDSP
jgi:predicted nucleic acid-binding protein